MRKKKLRKKKRDHDTSVKLVDIVGQIMWIFNGVLFNNVTNSL